MKIGIDSFRCFNHVKPVDIRPLTLLVGENSTGKSSFLAGLRFVNEIFERGANPSFNKDPYSLGSFKDIAHYRGGKAGRSERFSFWIGTEISSSSRSNPTNFHKVEINLTFREIETQPSISTIHFSCDDYQIKLNLDDNPKLSYRIPGMDAMKSVSEGSDLLINNERHNLPVLGFLLNEIPYILYSQRRGTGNRISENTWHEFSRILRRTFDSFPRLVFAGAPVRTKPARTYDNIEETRSPEGSHIPYLLSRLKSFRPNDWKSLRNELIDFGEHSGMFSDIDVRKFKSSADSPFQIAVKVAGPASNLVDVGYGVSQALPVVVETLQARGGSLFLLQQPEVHLHPRAQAALGSHLAAVAAKRNLTIVAETHSDFMIDRIRMDVRDGAGVKPTDVGILFFERTGLDVTIHQLDIDKKGNILGAPPGYRNFFLHEQMRSVE